jgi:hypothetical protein
MNIASLWKSLPRAARVYLTAVGALSVAGVAGVATVAATSTPLLAAAPSPSPSASPSARQAYCNTFTGHVAANLGKTPAQVQKAISDAIGQTLNDAVKNGDLTQQQADAIKSKVGSGGGQACAVAPGVIGRRGGIGIGGGFPRAALGLNEVAKALGISDSELQSDLRSGKTVKDLAAAKGMDEAAFRSKLASVTKADLDPQVASGKITQKQEDAALQRIQNGPLPLWDRPAPRLPGGRKANPKPSPSPTATP